MDDYYKEVTCVNMDLKNGYFRIRRGSDFELETGGVPVLSFIEKGIWHIISDPDPMAKGYFTMTVPHDFLPYRLKIKALNSTVNAAGISAEDVEIHGNNSYISVAGMNTRNIYISVGKGRVYADFAPTVSTYINCGFGEAAVKIAGCEDDYRIRSRRGGGAVYINGRKLEREWDNGIKCENEIVIKCGLGKVTADFCELNRD